ncbi:endolytic transglycosylase MltG [Filobacillus milosensis]|uniref:Endolytic murein transglycosylase n=1 Tax=Filobacillus milosensis TaxID=94137 RepID=A0A4Y8IUM7_9BACI|nr:endolytic transglycosylase MltG [Filobacillus milosensis]TFB24889.1 endolytic transglycosylase MltG [Filobacillus milosensis]
MSSNDQFNLKKQRIKEASTARKIIVTILTLIIITIGVASYQAYTYISEGLSPADPNDNEIIEVEIPLGSGVSSIGQLLEEKNIINDARIFKYYIKFKNETGFQAGEYKLSKSMTLDEIIESLKTGKILVDPIFNVTIPEGTTIEQIAEIYGKETSIDEKEFIEKMNDDEYISSLISLYPNLLSENILAEDIRYPLEGYLYPATYPFYEKNPTIEHVVEMMLQETADRILTYRQDMVNQELSVHEAITMASLIEEEAVSEEDRYMIAGVFYNRIEAGMPLQTDPTVLYALGEHKDRVLYKDLEVESPYNTYINRGLPIGPIANFRENAMKAALYPEDHEYYYFVAGYDGEVYYAETNAEHEANIREHRPPQD